MSTRPNSASRFLASSVKNAVGSPSYVGNLISLFAAEIFLQIDLSLVLNASSTILLCRFQIVGGEGGGKGHANDYGRATQKTVHTVLSLEVLIGGESTYSGNAFEFGSFQEVGFLRVGLERLIPLRVDSEEVIISLFATPTPLCPRR
jgi:hypothetical protein